MNAHVVIIVLAVIMAIIAAYLIAVAVGKRKKNKNPCRRCKNRRGYACLGCVYSVYGRDKK